MNLADIQYAKTYPILDLVRELQEERGYTHGLVWPEREYDQKTRCPIHSDGNPSAKAYVQTNSIYCWVCGRTWDPPALWGAYHGVPYPVGVSELLSRLTGRDVVADAPSLAAVSARVRRLFAALGRQDDEAYEVSVEIWNDQVWAWVQANVKEFPALDEVEDVLTFVVPHEELMVLVRSTLAWARAVHPELEVPPFEDPNSLDLLGLPQA